MTTIDISTLTFTNNVDVVPPAGTRAEIINTGTVDALDGDDSITGYGETLRNTPLYGSLTAGFYNESDATINTNNGNDEIIGSGGNTGIYNEFNATINTGNQDDKISGYASGTDSRGILNIGIIRTGSGNDTITGNATDNYSGGIVNDGTIYTDSGDDRIIGDGLAGGINNFGDDKDGIFTGSGDDSLIGTSNKDWGIYNGYLCIIDTGNGNDSLTGTSAGIDAAGILNFEFSTINTGSGNDTITGKGMRGIWNNGTINTDNGDDIVDALNGGFDGTGTILLGNGKDILKGFGSGFFDGDNGKDTLLFNTGTYSVSGSANDKGFYTISNGSIDMLVQNFDFIGSASAPAAAFSFASVIGGSFTI